MDLITSVFNLTTSTSMNICQTDSSSFITCISNVYNAYDSGWSQNYRMSESCNICNQKYNTALQSCGKLDIYNFNYVFVEGFCHQINGNYCGVTWYKSHFDKDYCDRYYAKRLMDSGMLIMVNPSSSQMLRDMYNYAATTCDKQFSKLYNEIDVTGSNCDQHLTDYMSTMCSCQSYSDKNVVYSFISVICAKDGDKYCHDQIKGEGNCDNKCSRTYLKLRDQYVIGENVFASCSDKSTVQYCKNPQGLKSVSMGLSVIINIIIMLTLTCKDLLI